jgi:hypothetical protein
MPRNQGIDFIDMVSDDRLKLSAYLSEHDLHEVDKYPGGFGPKTKCGTKRSCWFCSRRGGLRLAWKRLFSNATRRQADFFCGKLNGITFPYSSGRVHFVAFLLKLLGTKNSMIFAINHPTLAKTGLRQESSDFYKSLQMRLPIAKA